MKYCSVLAALLTLLLLLTACGETVPTVPTTPAPAVEATEPTADPIPEESESQPIAQPEEPKVIFSNQEERSRPYFIDTKTGEISLAFDAKTHNPIYQNNCVYYIDIYNRALRCHDLTTGEDAALVTTPTDWFRIEGNDLVYAGWDDFEYQHLCPIYHMSLSDGTVKQVWDQSDTSGALFGGWLYYTRQIVTEDENDWTNTTYELWAYNCATGQNQIIEPLAGSSEFVEYAVLDDGVYIYYSDDYTKSTWRCVNNGQKASGHWLSYLMSNAEMPLCANETTMICYSRSNQYIYSVQDGGKNDLFKFNCLFGSVDHYLIDTGSCVLRYEDSLPDGKPLLKLYLVRADSASLLPLGLGESSALFADGDFPRLHTSTARQLLGAALYKQFVQWGFGIEGAKPEAPTTHKSWLNIADRTADVGLLAAPTAEETAYLKEKGVEVEMKLYGGDGLIFIANAGNPVQNLTIEQIRGIYRGEITSWAELGGPDEPISVHYRNDQSGSQRMFEKLVFDGQMIPNFDALGFQKEGVMDTIVDECASDPYAIGYTVMTYLNYVYQCPDVQVFSVNDVPPEVATLQDESYPFCIQEYVVIRADEPENSPARRLSDWFGCPISQELLLENGVIPLNS